MNAAPPDRRLFIGAGGGLLLAATLSWPAWFGSALETSGYMPHGHCYLWQPGLVGLHVVSDGLIALAYLSISATLVYLVYRARNEIPFTWMFLAFGAFILACGATHLMEVWTLWRPDYWVSGNVKLVTAVASVTTALLLPPLVPRVLRLVSAEHLAEARRVQLVDAEERIAMASREQAARRDAEEARREAEAANRAKDHFLATVSHELRNPLSPILMWSRMLRAGSLDESVQREAIDAIERCATAQSLLLDDLLDVARIVSGKFRLELRPIAVAPLIDAAVAAVRVGAEAKQIRLETHVDAALGMISGDPVRLQQVVWNLLSNAVRATPRGGRIQVRLVGAGAHVEVSVVDDGEGIEPELLPHLFEHFVQGDADPARHRGSLGLGLAIVRHIAEAHGGSVAAESAGRGHGSVFRVVLPILSAVPPEAQRSPGEHAGALATREPAPLADLTGVRVLVVDDDPDSNAAVRAALTGSGADVRTTSTPREALEIFEAWRPSVLVSAVDDRAGEEFSLIVRIRARPRSLGGDVPAIALSASARTEDGVRALEAGFQTYLAKPADPNDLAAAVGRLARHERA